jgi:hypothetical protein
MIARQTVKVICDYGHEHEVDLPDDLISMADASRLVGASIQSIKNNVDARRIIGYPTEGTDLAHYRREKRRAPKTLISRAEIIRFYGIPVPTS